MEPPSEPGDRRPAGSRAPSLERPPGDRYASPPGEPLPPRRSTARAVAIGALAALAGAGLLVVLGGLLSLSAGLLVVAAAIGWVIGRILAGNAGPATAPAVRSVIAAALALDAVVLGQFGLWVHALSQGGALGLVEYLAEARGLLVPAEIAVAMATAWWTAR